MPYADSQGTPIYYEVEGQGPPLVLVHGFAGRSKDWREFGYVESLKTSYRLILIDERGHGASEKPHDPASYAVPLRVSDVTAILDSLDVRQAHVWGYSMGGEMCFGLAEYAPERLLSLIIGGMHPYRAQHPEVYDQQIEVLRQGIEAAASAWLPPARRPAFLRNDAQALIAVTLAGRDSPGSEAALPAMRMPCLLYAGERDERMHRLMRECASRMPDATFVSLPGLGHGQAYVRSDLVLPHVLTFLTDTMNRGREVFDQEA